MPPEKPCRIVVIDDDQMIRELFTIALQRDGFEVLSAATGAEGLAIIAANDVEIALLDIHLPDISGIDVTRQLVKTTSVSVILLTGDEANYSYASAIHDGAADFIIKPIRIPELLARIERAREARKLAVDNERLVRELERMAIQDALTGLFNYRHFQNQLQTDAARCLRYQRPLSLIILDADHFKAVNDSLGHAEGDKVLIAISQDTTRAIRSTDLAFRYGGEEFAVLLPETRAAEASAVAERIRAEVERVQVAGGRTVTISAGVSQYCPPEDTETFVRRADGALYESKRLGRNRVTIAT
jgi:two-component system, cell cycle response regulator